MWTDHQISVYQSPITNHQMSVDCPLTVLVVSLSRLEEEFALGRIGHQG